MSATAHAYGGLFVRSVCSVHVGNHLHQCREHTLQVIARTGPQLLTDALMATGLQRKDGWFDLQYDRNGVGECGACKWQRW